MQLDLGADGLDLAGTEQRGGTARPQRQNAFPGDRQADGAGKCGGFLEPRLGGPEQGCGKIGRLDAGRTRVIRPLPGEDDSRRVRLGRKTLLALAVRGLSLPPGPAQKQLPSR
ncbi:MAG: hypothetical protein MUC89_00285 [Acetobacteraceae bacterium]|jgi:hypothetical protein|nr:hypothetical protein [Acetobacteraceae bacterium]